MNIKTTKKEITNNFKNIICIGYCGASYLLSGKDRTFYTCGVYGWNADVYIINSKTCVVTGYRPFGNIEGNKLIKKYEDKASKIMANYDEDYSKRIAKINKLLDKYINEILKI